MEKLRIGLLGFDGVTAINLIGPLEAFSCAAGLADNGYEVVVIGVGKLDFTTDSGIAMSAALTTNDEIDLDTLIVPGGTSLRVTERGREIAEWIKTRTACIRRVASICTGIYALAPTGLVDGRRVTTHWRHARDVAAQFPSLKIDSRALFVRDGKYYSSGGATAGIDLCLALIEADYGDEVALATARRLLVYRNREGNQEQYAEPQLTQSSRPDRLGPLAAWIEQHLHAKLPVATLAQKVSLSYNGIIRAFEEAFGTTPCAYVKERRLEHARHRLAKGESVEAVARWGRFGSKEYFDRQFKLRCGIRPGQYQRWFGSTALAELK